MTVAEMLRLSDQVQEAHAALRTDLNARQPRTTKEEWIALDSLNDAAAHLRTAAVHLAVAQEAKRR